MSRPDLSDAGLRELARSLPWTPASGERALATERAIREAVSRPRRPRWPLSIAAAVACGVALALLPRAGPRVEILETRGATFRTAIEEELAIHLDEGLLRLDVEGLRSGQTFVVHVGPDRVVVRGTRFAVRAREGRLVDVRVERGVVEVHAQAATPATLTAGGSWSAPAAASARPVAATPPAAAPAAPRGVEAGSESAARVPLARSRREGRGRRDRGEVARAQVPAPDPAREAPAAVEPADGPAPGAPAAVDPAAAPAPAPGGDGAEAAFVAGFDALRRGEAQAAAELLEAVPASSPLAEDARYLRVLALVRGNSTDAGAEMEAFLAAFPGSPRAGAVALLLAERLVLEEDRGAALPHLRAATRDPDPAVRARARSLLLEIDGGSPQE